MSTLPPQPPRRPYRAPEAVLLDNDDYGTPDFITPQRQPRVSYSADAVEALKANETPAAPRFTPMPEAPVSEHVEEKDEVDEPAESNHHGFGHGTELSLHNALPPQVDVLVGNIVDHYSEQGKKDGLIALILSGSAFLSLVTGVFGPLLLALPLVLAIMGLLWVRKARRNGTRATAGFILSWAVIGVSLAGMALAGLIAGAAITYFGQ